MRHVEIREKMNGKQVIVFFKNHFFNRTVIVLDLDTGELINLPKRTIEEVYPVLVGNLDTRELKKYI